MAVRFTADARPSPEALASLRESVGWEAEVGRSARARRDVTLTAIAGDTLVGWASLLTDGVAHALVVEVIVHPAWQRRGVGSELVRRIVEKARERGASIFHVDFAPEHAPFYEACGFTIGQGGIQRFE